MYNQTDHTKGSEINNETNTGTGTASNTEASIGSNSQVNTRRKRKKHRKKHYLLRLLILAAIIAAAIYVAHLDYFNITEIAISGNEGISDEKVIELSRINTGQSIFDVHPLIAQHRIKKNMYVESVNVDRHLPGRIEIIITERIGMAQFAKNGKYIITDNEGNVLAVLKKERQIATVEGIEVTKAEKGSAIKTADDSATSKALNIIYMVENNDLYFKTVTVKGSKVTADIYDGLTCSGEYSNMTSCIKSGVLKSVIYDLYQKGTEKGEISVSTNDYCFFTPEN